MAAIEQATGGRVARNTTYLTVALIGQKILSSLYYFIIIKIVGPANAGDYIGATAVTAIFAVFIDVGLTTAFIRYIARNPVEGRRHFSYIITFKLITAVITTGLLFLSVSLLQSQSIHVALNVPNVKYVWWAAIAMVLDSLTATSYGYFRGIQHLEFESFGTILHRVTVMIVGISGAMFKMPPVIVIIAVVAGSAMNFLYAQFQLWRRQMFWGLRWSTEVIRGLLKSSWPFGVADFFKAIYASSDNILLTLFADRYIVGLYGFALKGLVTFQLIPSALVNALFPAMSALFLQSRDRLRDMFTGAMRYLIIIAVPITVIVFLLAAQIIIVFGGSRIWLDAILPLRILVLGLPFLFLNFPVGYLLNASNMERINTRNIAIVVILNLTSNLIFIREFTYISVAINSTISTALLFFLGVVYVRKIITVPIRPLLVTMVKSAFAGAIVALAGWGMMPHAHGLVGILWVGASLSVIYIILIFTLRLLRPHEVVAFIRRFRAS